MSNALGTIFEISLRCLVMLEVSDLKNLTSDMMTAIDFISVYGKDFGMTIENLHGDNNFKFSEFMLRRSKVEKAIKTLVLDGFVTVSVLSGGFSYAISDNGKAYCSKLESDYATAYRNLARGALTIIGSKSEREVIKLINLQSLKSARRSELNG